MLLFKKIAVHYTFVIACLEAETVVPVEEFLVVRPSSQRAENSGNLSASSNSSDISTDRDTESYSPSTVGSSSSDSDGQEMEDDDQKLGDLTAILGVILSSKDSAAAAKRLVKNTHITSTQVCNYKYINL